MIDFDILIQVNQVHNYLVLQGDEIHSYMKIIAIANVFDTVMSDQVYCEGIST